MALPLHVIVSLAAGDGAVIACKIIGESLQR
jgi:hypothetical protein